MSAARKAPLSRKQHNPLRHKIAEIKHGLETFAQTLTGNYRLRLIFKGTDARAEHDTTTKARLYRIYLPELSILERPNMTPDEVKEAENFLVQIRGLLYHECGHLMHTDWGDPFVLDLAHKLGGPKCRYLANACEDWRVDRLQSRLYRGAETALMVLAESEWQQVAERLRNPPADPKMRMDGFGHVLAALALRATLGSKRAQQTELWPLLSGKARRFSKRYGHLARKARTARSTHEMWEYAQLLWKAMKLAYDPPKDEDELKKLKEEVDPNADMEEPTKKEPKEREKDYKGDKQALSLPMPIPLPPPKEDDEKDNKEDAQPVSLAGDTQDGKDGADKGARLVLMAKSFAARKMADSQPDYLIYSTEGDTNVVPVITDRMREQYRQLDEEVQGHYGPVKRTLQNRLRARAQSFLSPGHEEGELDPAALHLTAVGRRNVFTQFSAAPDLNNTVCGLWFDTSGSMGYDQKLWLAKQAVVVFAEALNAVNIPFEVVSYTTGEVYEADAQWNAAPHDERSLYSRYGNLALTTHKTFEESWQAVRYRVMEAHTGTNTFDGECVKIACQRLLLRPQRRKVLFIMNDGEPCPNLSQHIEIHRAYLREVVAEMEAANVEVVAIGIQSDSVAEYYPRYVVVRNVSELPTIMAQELSGVLLGVK